MNLEVLAYLGIIYLCCISTVGIFIKLFQLVKEGKIKLRRRKK